MRRLLAAGGTALLAGVTLAATPVTLLVEYVLVAQRPDAAGAVHVPYTADFAACCSAFSASTFALDHPTPPVRWAQLMVHMTATTERDAVRLRRYSWIRTGEAWDAPSVYSAEAAPPLLQAPRTVGFYLGAEEWARPDGETHYVLETRGAPIIFGAKVRVTYVLEP